MTDADMWSIIYTDGQHCTEDDLSTWNNVDIECVSTVILTHAYGQVVCHIPAGMKPFFFRRRTVTVQQSEDADQVVTSVSVLGWRDTDNTGCYTWIYPDGSVAITHTDQ